MGIRENVDIKVSADNGAAHTVLERIAAALEKIATAGERTGRKLDGVFSGVLGDVGKFTLGMVGAQSITDALSTSVRLLVREYDNFLERNRKAADVQLPFADAQRDMSFMRGDTNLKAATERGLAITQKYGTPAAVVQKAFEDALSAKGTELPDEAAYAAVESAAKFFPGPRQPAEKLSAMAQAHLTIQKSMPGTTTEEAAASIVNINRASRDTSLENTARWTVPAIARIRGHGGDKDRWNFAASIPISIGQRSEDMTGRPSGTAASVFTEQVSTNVFNAGYRGHSLEEQIAFLFNTAKGTTIRKKMLGPYFNAASPTEKQLRDMPENEADRLAEMLVGSKSKMTLHGEAKQKLAMIEWLKNGPNRTKAYAKGAERVVHEPKDPRNIAELRAKEAELDASPFQTSARAERMVSGAVEKLRLTDPVAGLIGTMRKQIEEALQASGSSKLDQDIVTKAFDVRSGFARSPGDVVDAAEIALRRGKRVPQIISGPAMPTTPVTIPLTPQQDRQNRIFDEVLSELRALRKELTQPKDITVKVGGEAAPARSAASRAGQR